MKKLVFALSGIMAAGAAMGANNPMFGDGHINSVTLHVGQGTGPGSLFKLVDPAMWDIVPMTMLMAQYSQPMTLFRLPARQNLNVVQNFGYNSGRGLSFLGAGISWDVALLQWRGFYLGGGMGPYYRDRHDRYVASRLVFGEKFFIGIPISDAWRAEIFTLHFSNGDFTRVNRGFNFAGVAVNYSF